MSMGCYFGPLLTPLKLDLITEDSMGTVGLLFGMARPAACKAELNKQVIPVKAYSYSVAAPFDQYCAVIMWAYRIVCGSPPPPHHWSLSSELPSH